MVMRSPSSRLSLGVEMIELNQAIFDPLERLSQFESLHPELAGRAGACCNFIGTMRGHNEGNDVSAMQLEHYPGMTERELAAIRSEAMQRWFLLEALIIHRVGSIVAGEPIVLVAAWSAHRAAAFEACRYLIEELKHRAPFWKQETLTSGEKRWVERNTA